MLSDLLDALSNLLLLLPNGNKNNLPKERESETSIVLAITLTVVSAVMLFFNRQIFASEYHANPARHYFNQPIFCCCSADLPNKI